MLTSTVKAAVWKGVHGEVNVLAGMDVADVGFIDGGPDLEALEVLGDEEQAGVVEVQSDGLADIDPAVNDHAVHRRKDGAAIQVVLVSGQNGLSLARGGFGGIHGRFGDFDVGLGHIVSGFEVIMVRGRRRCGRAEESAPASNPLRPAPPWRSSAPNWPRPVLRRPCPTPRLRRPRPQRP